jgi:hypothetical protein
MQLALTGAVFGVECFLLGLHLVECTLVTARVEVQVSTVLVATADDLAGDEVVRCHVCCVVQQLCDL